MAQDVMRLPVVGPDLGGDPSDVQAANESTYNWEPLEVKIKKLQALAATKGIRTRIAQVDRSNGEQDRLYEQGRSAPGPIVTNAFGGGSLHNRHMAFDVHAVDDEGNPLSPQAKEWTALGQLGKELGLVWGGDFKSLNGDLSHFEMPSHVVRPAFNPQVQVPQELGGSQEVSRTATASPEARPQAVSRVAIPEFLRPPRVATAQIRPLALPDFLRPQSKPTQAPQRQASFMREPKIAPARQQVSLPARQQVPTESSPTDATIPQVAMASQPILRQADRVRSQPAPTVPSQPVTPALAKATDSQNAAKSAATLPVISPEGQFGYIPPENSEAALAKGFKHAIAVVSPEGQDGWIPAENAAAALKKQFKIGTSAQLQAEKGPDSGALDLPNVNKALREGVLGAASAVGLPESTNPQDFNPAPGLKQIFTHPIDSAKALGGAIYDAQAEQHELANRAQKAGDTYGALVHGVAAAIPLVGPAAVKSGEEIGRGIQNRDLGQAAHGLGAGAGLVGSLATGTEPGQAATEGLVKGTAAPIIKGGKAIAGRTAEAVQNVKQVINPVKYMTAEQAATKAIRPRNAKANFPQELQTALPDAKRAADALQIDSENMTLDDALKAVNQAKKDVWGEYQNNHLDPNVGVTVDTSPVADAMRKTVSKRIAEQNPALAKKVLKNADSYDGRDLSVQDLEDRVRELNNQTRAIEARYVVDKRAAKLNPRNAALFAERDGLRQLLLDKMNETAPAFVGTDPAASAAALRQRYGNLLSVEDSISRRVPVANRQAPKGLTDILRDVYGPAKIAKGLAQIGTGVGALHGLANIIEGGVEMKMANNAKLVNNPDYLIGRAFAKTAARPPAQLRNIIEGEYVSGDHGPFQTPQAASYPDRQLPSGEPVRNELSSGRYEGQPSPLDAIFRPRQPQLQKAPSIPPSRQLPAKGAIPLGPSGSTGATNIEPVRLPWSNAVVAPEGQAVADAVTKGAKPRQFTQPQSSNPLPFLRQNVEAAAPIGQSIKAPKPQPSTPAPNPDDVAMSNRFRISQLQEALRKSTEPKERAELQSAIEQIKAQLPKRNEEPLLPWQKERRGGPAGRRFSSEALNDLAAEAQTYSSPEEFAKKASIARYNSLFDKYDVLPLDPKPQMSGRHVHYGKLGSVKDFTANPALVEKYGDIPVYVGENLPNHVMAAVGSGTIEINLKSGAVNRKLQTMNPHQFDGILAHELAHISRENLGRNFEFSQPYHERTHEQSANRFRDFVEKNSKQQKMDFYSKVKGGK